MTKNEVTVIGGAPYAVCLTDGREVSPGQIVQVELDETTRSQIATGTLNVVEVVAPAKETPTTRKASAAASTEGETE